MHSMQAGHMDKAQKYTDKALMQIEKLKSQSDNIIYKYAFCFIPVLTLKHIAKYSSFAR